MDGTPFGIRLPAMRRAVCPGSFDPVTRGHLDIFERTARLFDDVVVAIGVNPAKQGLFSPDERAELIRIACPVPVRVVTFTGLLVDLCRREGAVAVVKGVRGEADVAHELPMAQMNASLSSSEVDTVWLAADPRWSFVSSSLVREIALLGGDVAPYLVDEVARRTVARVAERAHAGDGVDHGPRR